jgi:hypothetical protein
MSEQGFLRSPMGHRDDGANLAGVVASFVQTHPSQEALRSNIGNLYDFVCTKRLANLRLEELEKIVFDHCAKLESKTRLVQQQAALFSPKGQARPVRYRFGTAFCSSCRMYKDHRKECPHCGHLEFTW